MKNFWKNQRHLDIKYTHCIRMHAMYHVHYIKNRIISVQNEVAARESCMLWLPKINNEQELKYFYILHDENSVVKIHIACECVGVFGVIESYIHIVCHFRHFWEAFPIPFCLWFHGEKNELKRETFEIRKLHVHWCSSSCGFVIQTQTSPVQLC